MIFNILKEKRVESNQEMSDFEVVYFQHLSVFYGSNSDIRAS